MATGTLHVNALKYPVISAQNNRKLEFTVIDQASIRLKTIHYQVVGKRATTSDPWEIEVVEAQDTTEFLFEMANKTVSSDDLNWKSMADLSIKQHLRLADHHTVSMSGGGSYIYSKLDASEACGYKAVSAAEMASIMTFTGDDAGNFHMDSDPSKVTGAVFNGLTVARNQIMNCIGYILGQTTQVAAAAITTTIVTNATQDATAEFSTKFVLTACQGTDGLTVGNYTRGKATLRYQAAAAGGYDSLRGGRLLDANKAISLPSTQLDHIRRASNDGANPSIGFSIGRSEDNLFVESEVWNAAAGGTVVYISVLDPDSVIEISFDQANSLNVLAAAAFAGIAGLASVGVATELQNLLTNSVLSTLFQQVAVALGSTTSAIITGYVSAIIAAYTNGWISDTQLFDLNQHYQWITSGASFIAASAAAGLAAQVVGGLLTYMGVTSDVVGIAMTAVGGAATGAGVALGMAAIMSKVVRHRYWGE